MLVRPDATYLDDATKQLTRVFPQGTEWLRFDSVFPESEVFANSVLEPAVGIGGDLALRAFANADWQNWASATKIATFELATRIGVPQIGNQAMGRALASIYSTIPMTISSFEDIDDPLAVVPVLLNNFALQVVQQLAGSTNMIAQVFAQVLAAAVWAVGVVADGMADMLEKNAPLPPLQTIDPATDTWQVNRVFEVLRREAKGGTGIQFPDGQVTLASNANYTPLFMPAYNQEKPWKIQWREMGIAAQQGDPQSATSPRGETDYKFDVGDASTFGFMPGTGTTLRVLQASTRFYATMRGNPVDRFTLRCRAVDRGCWRTAKAFDGSRDCRQCVTAESVWPTQGIAWAVGGAVPLNVTTPGENVGAFYSSTNKLLGALQDMTTRPGPLLYTVDWFRVQDTWKSSFERFWEFARSYWTRYRGWGWRGLMSRLASLMVAFEDEQGVLQLGGRLRSMPRELVASPRDDSEFPVAFKHSIFERIIKPFCAGAIAMQQHYLDTFEIAYVPPGAGALYFDNKVRNNALGKHFLRARAELLDSTKRMLVDLRQVSDPEYRRELEAKGVKASPVNPLLQGSPGVQGEVLKPDIKPARAPRRPPSIGVPPLRGATELGKGLPARQSVEPRKGPSGAGIALAATAAAAAALAIGSAVAMSRESDDEP